MGRPISSSANAGMQVHSFSASLYNLVDSLFTDTERLSERTQAFTRSVTRPDLGITRVFFRCAFGHWMVWERDSSVQFDPHAARGIA